MQLCDKHQSIALREFRAILSFTSEADPMDALFAHVATFSLSTVARSSALSGDLTMDIDAIAEQFVLTRGIANAIRLSRKRIMESSLAEMLQINTYPEGTMVCLPDTVVSQFEALQRMLAVHGLDADALQHCQSALSDLVEIYKAIAYLSARIDVEVDVLSRWQVSISTEYIRLIQARNAPALIILACYAAAMIAIRTAWYTQNWAEYALRGIRQAPGPDMHEWLGWLDWPEQQLEERLGELGAKSFESRKE